MDVSRFILAVGASAVLAVPVAHPQAADAFAAQTAQAPGPPKPWREVRGLGRVLNLSKPPVVIDEPGLYAIQQNWRFPRAAADAFPELIQITADSVVLDLHGFHISADVSAPPSATLLVVRGDSAAIRNGRLGACCEGGVAVASTGVGTTLDHLRIFSYEAMTFDGERATIRDSELSPRWEVVFAESSDLERNTIFCNRGTRCLRLLGDGNRITDNKMSLVQGGGIGLMGNGSLVANNVIDLTNSPASLVPFEVAGDHNVVRGNTVLIGGLYSVSLALSVSGTGNTLDANIVASMEPEHLARTGMSFMADGNYYGNNRMAAEVPFSLGGTVQIDWGGNVGY